MHRLLFTLWFWAVLAAQGAAAQGTVAFFGITLIDSSLGVASSSAPDSPERRRVVLLEKMVADHFTQEGYVLEDLGPIRSEVERIVNPAKCYGCDTRMAARLGADFSLVGEVQKVSNLILAMNLQMRDVRSGSMVKGAVVDIRGNTDESWVRGMHYMLNNRFFMGSRP